jgi:hypothetical protein
VQGLHVHTSHTAHQQTPVLHGHKLYLPLCAFLYLATIINVVLLYVVLAIYVHIVLCIQVRLWLLYNFFTKTHLSSLNHELLHPFKSGSSSRHRCKVYE